MKKVTTKNARKTLLRSSFIMLMVAVVTMTSATYAWFTTGKSALVKDIQFSAVGASGVEFSADAFHTGAQTEIDADDIYGVANDTTTNWAGLLGANPQANSLIVGSETGVAYQLDPVSSVNAATAGALSFYKALITGSTANITAAANNVPTGNYYYYQFNLYVRASGSAYDTLYLDLNNSTVTDKGSKLTSYASRIAIVDQGSTATTPTEAVALAGGTTAAIWEPKADRHTGYAINNRGALDSTRYAYNALKATGSDVAIVNGVVPDGTNASAATSYQYDYGYLKVGTIADSRITKLTVYVWFEGQDVDCENVIASGEVALNLKFVADKEETDAPSLAKTVTLSITAADVDCYGAPASWEVSDEEDLVVMFDFVGSPPNRSVSRGGTPLTVDTDYTWAVNGQTGTLTIKKAAITADLAISVTDGP